MARVDISNLNYCQPPFDLKPNEFGNFINFQGPTSKTKCSIVEMILKDIPVLNSFCSKLRNKYFFLVKRWRSDLQIFIKTK